MSEADKVKRRIQELEMDDSEAKNIVAQTLTDPLKCAERIACRVPRRVDGASRGAETSRAYVQHI